MNRKSLSVLGALFTLAASSVVLAQRPTPTLDTTASALYLDENPKADLSSPETTKAIAALKNQVQALLNNHVEAAKHEVFYRYEPFVRGEILLAFQPATQQKLEALLDANGNLDLSRPTGIAELDALNAKHGIQTFSKRYKFSSSFTLTFDAKVNPHSVADAYKGLTDLRYATPNGIVTIGGGSGLTRLAPRTRSRNILPAVYVLNLGWGDCPAGCIFNNRRYFEVRSVHDGIQTTYVGEAGAPLTPELKSIYK